MKGNQRARDFAHDTHGAAIEYVMVGIVILVASAIAINIVYPVIGSTNISGTDTQLRTAFGAGAGFKPVANASLALVQGTGTVMGLNPIMALVAVAAGIISLLMGAFITGRQV